MNIHSDSSNKTDEIVDKQQKLTSHSPEPGQSRPQVLAYFLSRESCYLAQGWYLLSLASLERSVKGCLWTLS